VIGFLSLDTLASRDQIVRAEHQNQNNAYSFINWLVPIDNGMTQTSVLRVNCETNVNFTGLALSRMDGNLISAG
jgi:hypothetical protein